MNMTCAIIDDEPLAVELLASYARKTPMLTLTATFNSAIEALRYLQREQVDLIFLDIQMPELTGMDLARMLDSQHTRIVFTTAFSEYAVDSYKVGAIDYLLKPISYTDFVGAVSRASKWISLIKASEEAQEGRKDASNHDAHTESDGYMFVKSDYKIVRINHANILYIEGLKDYVKIYLNNSPKPVLSLSSMKNIEETLPTNIFLRIHRSYIVNMQQVTVFERGQIIFGEKRLNVSDSYREAVQTYINAHLLQSR